MDEIMIEGINVLNVVNINNTPVLKFLALSFGMVFVLLIIVTIICAIKSYCEFGWFEKGDIIYFVVPVLSLLFAVFLLRWYAITDDNALAYTQYEVTISEDVRMKEFYEHFTVSSTRGNIYIIKIKEGVGHDD